MTAFLKTDLAGKIRNLPDFKDKPLLPVYEAVVNSIHAIEEAGRTEDGSVEVHVIRTGQGTLVSDGHEAAKIESFEIIDNGIGFNDNNYESFNTSDSTYKLNKGCKGVGRFLWLKAFKRAEVSSVYSSNGDSFFERSFTFDPLRGIVPRPVVPVSNYLCRTSVKLVDFKPDYRDMPNAYKTTEKIAQRIMEHCLAYYISGNAPCIVVIDQVEQKKVYLDKLFDSIRLNMTSEKMLIQDETFTVHHLRLFDTHADIHEMVFCADGRGVKSVNLHKDLGTTMQFDEQGKKFFYAAYIVSEYLDTRVDTYRQAFNIPERMTELAFDLISMEDIQTRATECAKAHLSGVLESVSARKQEMVNKYVADKNPMLRAVVKYCPQVLDEIELNSSEEKICEILYIHKGRAELDIKKRSDKLLKTQSLSVEEIDKEYRSVFEQLEDFQRDELAAYVLRRKLIIDLLENKLEINKDGKYHNEDIIHDIIFPRKADSNSVNYEDHNLWLIDDGLAFHQFACSDRKFTEFSSLSSEERPDIVIFAEVGEDKIARAVSLLEFKKPQRNKFDEDPTRQLYRYVRSIRQDKKFRAGNGRDIAVIDETRFYCYAICDITDQIKEYADNNNYAKLQGEFGYYQYNRNHNAHTTIVAFDKLVIDATKRHKAFFEKLGL